MSRPQSEGDAFEAFKRKIQEVAEDDPAMLLLGDMSDESMRARFVVLRQAQKEKRRVERKKRESRNAQERSEERGRKPSQRFATDLETKLTPLQSGELVKMRVEYGYRVHNDCVAFRHARQYFRELDFRLNRTGFEWGIDPSCKDVRQSGRAKVSIRLVWFNKPISRNEVLEVLSLRGERPAVLEEIIAIARFQPGAFDHFPIVGLGTNEQGAAFMAKQMASTPTLYLTEPDPYGFWRTDVRFAVVNESVA